MYNKKINYLIDYLNNKYGNSFINESIELQKYGMALESDSDPNLREVTSFLSANFVVVILDEIILEIIAREHNYELGLSPQSIMNREHIDLAINGIFNKGKQSKKNYRLENYLSCIYAFDKASSISFQEQSSLWNKTAFKMQLYKYDCKNIDKFCENLINISNAMNNSAVVEFSTELCNRLKSIKAEKKMPYIHFIDIFLHRGSRGSMSRNAYGLAHDLSHMFVTGPGERLYDYKAIRETKTNEMKDIEDLVDEGLVVKKEDKFVLKHYEDKNLSIEDLDDKQIKTLPNDYFKYTSSTKNTPIIVSKVFKDIVKKNNSHKFLKNDGETIIELNQDYLTKYDKLYYSISMAINRIFANVIYATNMNRADLDSQIIIRRKNYLNKHLEYLKNSNEENIYGQYNQLKEDSKAISGSSYVSNSKHNDFDPNLCIETVEDHEGREFEVIKVKECIGSKIFENQIGFQRPLLGMMFGGQLTSGESGDFLNDILGNLFITGSVTFNNLRGSKTSFKILKSKDRKFTERFDNNGKLKNNYISPNISKEGYMHSYYIDYVIDLFNQALKDTVYLYKSLNDASTSDLDQKMLLEVKNSIKKVNQLSRRGYAEVNFSEYLEIKNNKENKYYLFSDKILDFLNFINKKIYKLTKEITVIIDTIDNVLDNLNPEFFQKIKDSYYFLKRHRNLSPDSDRILNFQINHNQYLVRNKNFESIFLNDDKNPKINSEIVKNLIEVKAKKHIRYYFFEDEFNKINKIIDEVNKMINEFLKNKNKNIQEEFLKHILRRKLYSYNLNEDAIEKAKNNDTNHEGDTFYEYKKIFENLHLNDSNYQSDEKTFLEEYLSNYFFTFERIYINNANMISEMDLKYNKKIDKYIGKIKMNMVKRARQILKYSDYELLSIFLNIIIIFLNPYILLNTFTNAPYWLIFLGIPFGLYSVYHTLNDCKKSKDFSINLNIGQVLGITIYSLEVNTLCIPFICQLVILLFLKWRSSRDVARMDLREK